MSWLLDKLKFPTQDFKKVGSFLTDKYQKSARDYETKFRQPAKKEVSKYLVGKPISPDDVGRFIGGGVSSILDRLKPPTRDIKTIGRAVMPPVKDFKRTGGWLLDKLRPPTRDFKTVGKTAFGLIPKIGETVGEGITPLAFGDVRQTGIEGIPKHIWDIEKSILEIAPKFGFSTHQAFKPKGTLLTGKTEEKPYTLPSSKITERLGFKKEYSTYQKEFEKTADEIIDGKKPLWHALIPFAEVPFDGMIVSSFLTSGAKSIFKKVKVNSNETAGAIKAMGLKDISVKAQKTQYRKLAHELHPDKVGVQSDKLFKELNNANNILNKARSQGLLVKEPSKIALAMKGIAETGLRKPSEIGKTFAKRETPYLGVKGLLPEQAGTIPTRPFQARQQPAGLSIRDIEAKPIKSSDKYLETMRRPKFETIAKYKSVKEKKFAETMRKVIDTKLEALSKADPLITEARKYKSAEEFIQSVRLKNVKQQAEERLTKLKFYDNPQQTKTKALKEIAEANKELTKLPDNKLADETIDILNKVDTSERGWFEKAKDFYNKATKPTPKADPLITEARKYKSAEEFVKAQPKVYHGTNKKFTDFAITETTEDKTLYFAKNKKFAKVFGENIKEVAISKDAKIFDILNKQDFINFKNLQKFDVNLAKDILEGRMLDKEPIVKQIKEMGYDGYKLREETSSGKISEVIGIFNPKSIKTKSQLTDIYNKAKALPEAKKPPVAKSKAEEGRKGLPTKKSVVETPVLPKKVSPTEFRKGQVPRTVEEIKSQAYKDIKNKLSTKTVAQIDKLSSIPASKVKQNIHKMVSLKKSDELKKLNEYYAEEAKMALENKSLTDFKRATAISKEIEKKIKAKVKPLEDVKDISKTELGVDEIDIIKKEYPSEFAIGKMEKEQKMIEASSEGFFDELSKMKLSDAELKNVFDYRETKSLFKLDKFSSKQVEKIKKINSEITKITSYIDDKLEGFGLLDERLNENTYIRAYLRNLDGSPASLDKIIQLRIDQGASFRELMSSASQKIKKSTIKETRKYDTADARDAVLKRYGLKTDRDLLRVMTNYISSMNGMIGNHTLNNTLRAIARSGKKSIPTKGPSILKGRIVSKSAIREIYNPKDLTKFRTGLSKELKATREGLLDLAKRNRALTDDQIKIIQKSKKPLLKTESDDILEELGTGTKDIKEFFDEVIENVKGTKKETTEFINGKIRIAKEQSLSKLRNQYETIAKEKAILEEQGFKDLGVRGAEPLRGVMGQKLERDFVEEIVKVRSTTSIGANLDQISQTGKLMMAVGDLFTIPRTWWLRVQETGMIKGSKAYWDDIMGITFKRRTPERISKSAEFIRTDRQTIGDVDTLKKFKGEIDRELSSFEKFIDKTDTLTDIKGIQQAKKGIVDAFQGLENWQFKKLMTSAKDDLWRIKVKQLTDKGISLREAQIEAGRSVDILSGVSNFKKIMAKHPKAFSQSIQKGLRISLFAPNLFVTMGRMLKTYGIDIFAGGARGALARQATIRMLIWSQVILQSLSFALNKHSTFENEDKKKILALKVPGMLDEKGNQYYLNPLGWIAKPFDLVMRPNESAMNKIALLPRFAMNLFLSPYKYEDSSKSRIGGALSGVVPLPFTLQGLLNYGMSKFQEDEQYGVAENVQQQMMLSALEFFGFEGVYTSGKAKTTVATDVMKQVKEAFDDPNNFKNLPIYIENWLLSKDLPSEPKSEYEKAVSEDKEKDKKEREALQPKFDEIDRTQSEKFLNALTEREYKIYKKRQSAEKTKDTNKKKEEFYPTFKKIRDVGEKDEAEAMKIINSLTDEEYRIYELLRNQLD